MNLPRILSPAVDQHIDADVDAGAHAIGAPNFAIQTNMMMQSSWAQPTFSDSSQSCRPGISYPDR